MAATSSPETEASSRDLQAEALRDDDDLVLSSSTLAALQACCLQTSNILVGKSAVWHRQPRRLLAGRWLCTALDNHFVQLSPRLAVGICRNLRRTSSGLRMLQPRLVASARTGDCHRSVFQQLSLSCF